MFETLAMRIFSKERVNNLLKEYFFIIDNELNHLNIVFCGK